MRLGTTIPFGEPQEVVELAQMAERLGFDSLSRLDILTTGSPGSGQPPPDFYESLISLAYLAAVTERIRLLVNVIILPLREPVVLAKQLAALDRFSGGRLLCGMGLGTSRAGFEAIRVRDRKANRGKILDEGLEVLNLLLTQDDVSYQGSFFDLKGVSLRPRSAQNPLPIYISGNAPATLARVARWATGWIHSTHTAKEPFPQRLNTLSRLLEARGRDLSEIDAAVISIQSLARTHEEAVKRFLNSRVAGRSKGHDWDTFVSESFIGTPTEVAEKIDNYRTQGATHCIGLHIAADNFQELKEQIQMFGEEVLPLLKGS